MACSDDTPVAWASVCLCIGDVHLKEDACLMSNIYKHYMDGDNNKLHINVRIQTDKPATVVPEYRTKQLNWQMEQMKLQLEDLKRLGCKVLNRIKQELMQEYEKAIQEILKAELGRG
mmetsp:Transcript_63476/g.112886  ORF Transcript_63476/g.112886 Transcript_63476/m.112886 type:complete len:117 (+) Transcript_63476:634-984(+)